MKMFAHLTLSIFSGKFVFFDQFPFKLEVHRYDFGIIPKAKVKAVLTAHRVIVTLTVIQ